MKKRILILILIGFFLIIGVGLVLQYSSRSTAKVVLKRHEYIDGENLQVQIENYLSRSICFSSCYPYLLQKRKDHTWESYQYGECQKENINEICLAPEEKKAFELSLGKASTGLHRLAIPVCEGCVLQEEFQESKKIYSPEFRIR